ncbi:6-hydroxy-D-nicotine oxidase (plasmid) [Pseudoseohaeicola sp. NH-UV-7]|uniref:FAD-binding oxidoreductase n=1 Tax=unclassified Sulfitobacter TaxID=196795 RepID=UPI000E0C99FF|nr:FAD-binding oxidoreductase [Sulfitobacter sp. JL08]AXI55089.1 FAD-linked oxidase [Sulfitobacter sp. JL08]
MGTEFQTLNGERMSIGEEAINDLETAMRGRLLRKDHPDYDNARRIWNGMIDKQPALIAECTGTADIITAVQFAAEHGLLTSVRGGGHNIAGSAVCDNGLMIDLSGLRAVRVDPEGRRAFVQPGALLGDVDHETQAFGLAVPTGINSTTGIAGLALGGGYGWLSRKYGHTVDNIVSVRIVTADGGLKRASADENADLFWAIRGGSGNFGIVTEFEFELHPVETSMMTGPVVHSLEDAASALKMYRDIAARLPDEATCWFVLRKAPPLPFLAPEHHGKTVLLMPMAFAGLLSESEEALAPLRSIGNPIADGVSLHPYTGWQSAFDPLLTEGARNYWKSHDFTELTDDVVDLMVEAASDLPTDECEIFVAQLGGAAGRVDEDAMAYAHRKTRYAMNIHARWTNENQDAVCKTWARALFDKATPLAEGSVYINFVPEAGEERSKGAFGANQARLESIKAKVDPANLFRANVMIQPDP